MRLVTVKRIEQFNAAHRLYVPEWTDEQNEAVFDKCNNPNFHGHNYKVEVLVKGPVDPITGYVIDLKLLKKLINDEILEAWDHRNLNLDVPEFSKLIPTAENIAIVAYDKLRAQLDSNLSLKVIIHETAKNSAEYSGEE